MTFANHHHPETVQQLVFRDPAVASIIADYAAGTRTQHLLLHGPAGSGKSIAAQVIINTQLSNLVDTDCTKPINPRDYSHTDFAVIMNTWNIQRMNGARQSLIIIDEVDFFSLNMQQKLRAFIDGTKIGTIIATTNDLHKLDQPLKDRFKTVLVARPFSVDWITRAQEILAVEGINLSLTQTEILLQNFEGSARSLINHLEDTMLTIVTPPAQSVILTNDSSMCDDLPTKQPWLKIALEKRK